MQWLNYQHLLYLWAVARRGSVTAAAEELSLSGPTLSAQIRKLEESLGEKLLRRSGQRMVLTDAGRLIMPYAEQIFSLGQQITELSRGGLVPHSLRLAVGSVLSLSHLVVYRLLEPALRVRPRLQLVVREGRPDRLLADLAAHDLDIVFSDTVLPAQARGQFFSHFLGETGMSFYAVPRLAALYRARFPRSLHGAPLLLPSEHSAAGHALDLWLETQQIRPEVIARFDGFAMARVFAESGEGVLAAPWLIEDELEQRYGVRAIARIPELKTQFYAISLERKIQHPGVAAICNSIQDKLLPFPRERRRRSRGAAARRCLDFFYSGCADFLLRTGHPLAYRSVHTPRFIAG